MDELDARPHRIGQHHFRARFRLRGRDRAVVDLRGIATVCRHAEELVERRLAPAEPRNDGRRRQAGQRDQTAPSTSSGWAISQRRAYSSRWRAFVPTASGPGL